MPCFLQAASTLSWLRKGWHSIWLQTTGSGETLAASSSSATVKFDTPIARTCPRASISPWRRASRQAARADWASGSAAGRCDRGAAWPGFPSTERSTSGGARAVGCTLVVTMISARGTPEARTPCPTSASLPYICAVSSGGSRCGSPARRCALTSRSAQVPSPTMRDFETLGFDHVHVRFTFLPHLRGSRAGTARGARSPGCRRTRSSGSPWCPGNSPNRRRRSFRARRSRPAACRAI